MSGMNRFFVQARVPKYHFPTTYAVLDKDHCVPGFGAKPIAWSKSKGIAEQIANMLEAAHVRETHERSQRCCCRCHCGCGE